MTRKKIIFVIVEGSSDETALGAILQNIFDVNQVHIEVVHGDITTQNGVMPHNILSKIGDMVAEYIKQNRYLKKSDFERIIHIVDMDGAYIPDANIIEDNSVTETAYSLANIITTTNNKPNIIKRNRQKTANINKICSCHEIGKKETIPYKVFYMSCNLDHVLHDKINSTDAEKKLDSRKFAKQYKENIHEFLSFISESDFSVKMPYKESWDFIKQGLHSLERHTNFGICFSQSEET